MSNKLEDVKKLLGKPVTRKFKDDSGGEIELEFYPLGIDSLPDFMELQQKLAGDPENVLKRENSELMIKLIRDMLTESFGEDFPKDIIDKFAMRHLPALQEILVEVNIPKGMTDEKMEKIKKKIQQVKDAKATGN